MCYDTEKAKKIPQYLLYEFTLDTNLKIKPNIMIILYCTCFLRDGILDVIDYIVIFTL